MFNTTCSKHTKIKTQDSKHNIYSKICNTQQINSIHGRAPKVYVELMLEFILGNFEVRTGVGMVQHGVISTSHRTNPRKTHVIRDLDMKKKYLVFYGMNSKSHSINPRKTEGLLMAESGAQYLAPNLEISISTVRIAILKFRGHSVLYVNK